MRYDAESGTRLFDFDTWARSSGISGLPQQSRVDVLADAPSATPVLTLIEVKDFRILTRKPGERNLSELHLLLAKKLAQTLHFLETHEECPENLHNACTNAVRKYFVAHIEMPEVPASGASYFPSGYPLSQFQMFRASAEAASVDDSFLRNARSTNADTHLPWCVTLLP